MRHAQTNPFQLIQDDFIGLFINMVHHSDIGSQSCKQLTLESIITKRLESTIHDVIELAKNIIKL